MEVPSIETEGGILDGAEREVVMVLFADGVESGVELMGSEFQDADVGGEDSD